MTSSRSSEGGFEFASLYVGNEEDMILAALEASGVIATRKYIAGDPCLCYRDVTYYGPVHILAALPGIREDQLHAIRKASQDANDFFHFDDFRKMQEERLRELAKSDDPDVVLAMALWNKQQACSHSKVPIVKSYYSDDMVQRGICPDCNVHMMELD
jgi:hypothetical protein